MERNDIFVVYGHNEREMTELLLKRIGIESLIVDKNTSIVLKPNLVVARPPEEGATTHPNIIETTIIHLQSLGYRNITIAESAWVGDSTDRAFKVHGYYEMAKRYGIKLLDVKDDQYVEINKSGVPIQFSKTVYECGFLINFPVLKGHCQTTMTCALKNLKGCISDRSKRQFHTMGLNKPIAVLNSVRCAELVIVDSLNGDLDFEEGGNPVQTNRMFAGRDSVLVDTFGADLMGFEVRHIPYISLAESLTVGSTDISKANIVELNNDRLSETAKPTGKVRQLAKYTDARSACSACYGNLIHALARLEEKGSLRRLNKTIHIGQGYKQTSFEGLGVGICTRQGSAFVPGCPPKALDILRFLEEHL